MRDSKESDEKLLERLFDFLFPGDEGMTRAEVQEDLRQRRINVGSVVERVEDALTRATERERAEAALESARKRRPSALKVIQDTVAEKAGLVRESIEKLLREKLAGAEQAVYMRKLKSAASDEDLLSLLDDLARIEKLPEESDHGES